MNTDKLNFVVPSKTKLTSFAMMAVGLVSIVAMFMMDKGNDAEHYHAGTRAWANVFVGGFFFTAIALGASFFMASKIRFKDVAQPASAANCKAIKNDAPNAIAVKKKIGRASCRERV